MADTSNLLALGSTSDTNPIQVSNIGDNMSPVLDENGNATSLYSDGNGNTMSASAFNALQSIGFATESTSN